MSIQKEKRYKTACGFNAEVFIINDPQVPTNYPVIGAYLENNEWHCARWTLDGKFLSDGREDPLDLVLTEFQFYGLPEFDNVDVNYFGLRLSISSSIKWLATDEDGTVYGYFNKPEYYNECVMNDDANYWDCDSYSVKLCKIKYKGDARKSLVNVSDIAE